MKPIYLILGVVAIVFIGLVGSYVSANNTGAMFEADLVASRDNGKNVLTQTQNTIMEMVQVPEMAKDDIKEVVAAALEGRYGEDGSQAVFQSIQEQNPSVDPKLYTNVQDAIQSGRKNFEREQTRMIDIRAKFQTSLRTIPTGFFMRLAGYPTVDFKDFEPITTSRVDKVFETGNEEVLKLRN